MSKDDSYKTLNKQKNFSVQSDDTNNSKLQLTNEASAENDYGSAEGIIGCFPEGTTIEQMQMFNEAIIKLSVLLYQIDGKITLTEQDYFEFMISNINWKSNISIEAFINDAIHQARVSIDRGEAREFLFGLSNGLNINPAQALEVAMDITEVDGVRSEDELELLSLLSNRVLAKGLVA